MKKVPLPSPEQIKQELPLASRESEFIKRSRLHAKQIVGGSSSMLAAIIGPCSIDDEEAAIEYGLRLQTLASAVKDSMFLVMRTFVEKPRTQLGWKGILYDPHLDGSHNIEEGIRRSRKLFLKLASLEIPCACELLDPLAAEYFSDVICWGFVGARTSASPIHRQMASGLDFPIGFKNSLHGEIDVAIAAVLAAKAPHVYLGIGLEGNISSLETSGNPWTHIVLRGAQTKPNFDERSIAKAERFLGKHKIPPRLLIDCAHGNSGKNPIQQKVAFESVLRQIREGSQSIFGVMLESYLASGNQPLNKLRYGVSVTDPCLGWTETEDLICSAFNSMSSLQK
ncbi:MAG: 3-deoxy-7-phosphoheptulonate synthase [Chlamydiae bacterium]|nr:3-deoxy-7-phosphoheptulonate synthase [Chlamydiota bacterium]